MVAAYLAFSPIQAAESAVDHRQLEEEIVDKLARGQDVASLVERITPRDASAARYRQDETALHTDKALAALRGKLQSISSKKVLGKEDVASLLADYDEFKANHLLLKEQFESTRVRLDAAGVGSDIRKRLDDAELAYDTRVAKVQALEGVLERLKQSSDQAKLLSNADFKKKALSDIRASLASLDKHSHKSRATILRASTLPYRQAQLPSRAPVVTPTIQPSYRSTSDSGAQPQLADTADSIDAPLSDEIIQQAKDLDYDYIRIYEFVRNSIKTEWYAGGMKGAIDTLRERSGNDIDQASLLIALFRASGLASRYVHGVVELPIEDVMNSLGLQEATQATTALTRSGVAFKPVIRGGRVAAVQVEHTWVAAHVPYTNYRGSVVDGSGKTWLPLAPSLKQYQWSPSTAVFRKAGVTADSLIGAYLSAPQSTDLLSTLRKQVTDYILANTPEQTYEQQLGSRTIASLNIGLLPTSLPVTVVAVTGESAALADSHRQRVRIVARQGSGATDPIILDVTVPIAEVAGNRLTLSYMPATVDDQKIVNQFGGLDLTPAYLIKLRPQIKIDGKQRGVAQESLSAGVDHRFELYVLGPSGSQRIEQTFVAGSYHAIGISGQMIDNKEGSLEEQVNESSDPADTEYPAARILSWRALNYIDKWNQAEAELAGLLNVAVIRPLPAITIASNASRVDYVLGQPMKLQWQGVTLDAALRLAEPIAASTDTAAAKEWMRLSALQGSSLEHLLFERDFLVDSISADKGLGFARANDIPVYTITSANISTVLPELTHPANVKSDMENWIRLGMSVETPRDPIRYQAWLGSVWRVEDPKTGGAGYFIAGSLAGGATAEDLADWPLQALADLLQSPNAIPSNPDPLAGAEVVKLTTTDGQTGKAGDKLSSPLAVMVRDSEGHPVKGAQVTFAATAGGGRFDGDPEEPGIQEVAYITTTTNALGIAQVDFILGKHTIDNPVYVMANKDDTYLTRAGLNYVDIAVEARFRTLTSEPFTAIAHPKTPAKLVRTNPSASTPSVPAGLWVDTIVVSVQDEFENAVSNVKVAFATSDPSPVTCSNDTQPMIVNPVVFDASTDSNTCPANPILGDCGSASREAVSSVYGVNTGVISGLGLTSFSVQASAQGIPGASWQYLMPSVCDEQLMARAISTGIINDQGKLANAAKVTDIFKRPIEVTLLVGDEKFGWKRANAESTSFKVDNSGVATGTTSLGNGLYRTNVITGATPGLNKVTFSVVNPGGIKRSNGSNWEYGEVINGVYGLDPTITRTESLGQDPGVIYLDDLGKSAFPVNVHYTVPPAEYMSITTEVDFLKNGVWDDSAIVTARSGDGSVPLPRGAIYNLEDKHEAQLVINRGSDAEVKSDPFRLRMRQQIFKNVSRQVRISQDVDFINQRMCEMGAQFSFTLTQPATVTLSFKELRSTIAKTLISNQSFPQGEHSIDILPDDLSPGDYTFELKGVSELDGHEDIEQGTAVAEFRGTNELPVGQTLVKGVNVKSGHLTLSAEEFTLPGRGVPLSFSRTYSSAGSTTPGVLGIGWSHNYDSKVIITPCGEVIVNGMRFVIDYSQSYKDGKQGYKPLKGYHGTLTQNYTDGSFDFYSKDGTHYHFRKMGNTSERYLDAIADNNGNVTRLGYDPADLNEPKLITVQDSSGRALSFTYEIKNFTITGVARHKPTPVITKVSAPDGIELKFEYDEFGNLSKSAREGDSRIETYTYSKADSWALDRKLASHTNPLGGTTSYSYKEIMISIPKGDGTDLVKPDTIVTTVTEPEGGVTQFQIDPASNSPSTVTDPRGKATIYTMNGYGSVLSIQDPISTTTMTWATDDIVMTSKTDGRGVTTDYTYDSNGNVLSEKTGTYTTQYTYKSFTSRPIKNRVETVTDRNGNTTINSYDERGNLFKVTNPEGGVVEHNYYTNGDRSYTKDPNGKVTRFTYDGYGNVETVTDPLGGITTMHYDARSQLRDSTDPLARKTLFDYYPLGNLKTKTDALGGVHAFTYDPAGNKLTETDANGHTTSWSYDRENRIKTTTNALGDVKSFGYDAAGNKTSESDWRANATSFAYDDANRLITRTEELGRITRFGYDKAGNVTSETDPLNRVTTYDYDALNRRTQITDALLQVTKLGYDGINKVSETDALSRITSYVYDKNNRLLSKNEPLGRTTTFEYDANGNRTAEIDPNGNRRTFEYDALNRVVKKNGALHKVDSRNHTTVIAYDAVGNVVSEINPRLAQIRHEYDELNRRLKTIDPAGMATQFSYDSVGNRTGELWANGNSLVHGYDALNRLKSTTDSLGAVVAYNYDANGNRTEETDARGNAAVHTYDELNRLRLSLLPEARTVKFDYDLAGNKTSETDANNNVTAFGYDALNRLTTLTDPFGKGLSYSYDAVGNKLAETDKRNNTTSFEYDALNRLVKSSDPLGQSISFGYDANGNKLSETDKRGTTTTYSYDKENRPLTTVKGGLTLVRYEYDEVGNKVFEHDALGNINAYKYDQRNLLTLESRPLAAISNFKYDAMGDRSEVRDPEARISSFTYDLRRRLQSESNGAGETTAYTYDGNGNRLSQKRPLGNSWSYSYDAANRLTGLTDPLQGTTGYSYDKNGNRLSQSDANGNTTRYEYDALNRQTAMVYADNARIEFRYDENGNRTGLTDAKGQVYGYSYDALNRETVRSYPAPTPASDDYIQGITTQYDANSNVTGLSEAYSGVTGTRLTAKSYDSFDRLLSVTDAFGKTLKYQYDANGNRTRLTDPDNNVTQYSFDALNRLVGVMNGGGATSYQYDRSGLKTKVSYPNGTQAVQSYDRAMRVSTIDNQQNSALVSAYQYQYDANGNRTQQLETNGGAAETTSYSFDGNDRLTDVVYPNKTTSYSYDANYNRLTERSLDSATQALLDDKSYRYNSRNQLETITDHTDSVQSVSYSFDANGNQTLKTKNGSITTFLYDTRDQLVSVQENATTLGMFYYDYQGMRIAKDMGGQIVRYTYDGKSVLTQSDVNGQTIAKYEYGPDQLLSLQHVNEGRQFYLFDALGSVSNLTNTAGLVQARYQYDAFGNMRAEAGSSFNRFTFTGHEKDTETGLYYFKARFYDPDTGRFINQDPYLGDVNTPPSLHRYLFAYANPVVWVDLTGYSNILLPQHLEKLEEESKKGMFAGGAEVDYEAAQFTQAVGGKYDTLNGYAVRKPSAQKVSERVRSVVGNQEGATALVIEEGDTFESVVKNIDEQLGTRWHRGDLGKSQLSWMLRGARAGDIIDISELYRNAYNDTLRANYSELQDFARDQRETAAATGFTETPDTHINAVSASLAAELQRTVRLANDPAAPPFLRKEARKAIGEGVGLLVVPIPGTTLSRAASASRGVKAASEATGSFKTFVDTEKKVVDEARAARRPAITFSKSDPDVADHAQMVERAQQAGHPSTLTRGVGKRETNRNRYQSQKEIRKRQGPPNEGYNYDEYPYASSQQGGAGAHVEELLAEPNQEAGRRLGRFLEGDNSLGRKIKPGEEYNVIIVK